MQKRGQITIFIIIGIIVILTIAGLIIFREQITVFKPEKVLPPEVAPLQRFVENCVQTTAREGITILAANGGFIRFPDSIELDSGSYISTNPFFPEFKIPLWRYNGQTRIPSEDYIKQDLRYYIQANINSCLHDLETFANLFDIEKGEMSIEIDLLEKGTVVELFYPLAIHNKLKNQTTRIDSFKTTVPLRLKAMYDLAKKIMEEENTDKFLEMITMDLVALDVDIPYTDLEFTCDPKIWKVSDVRDKLKHLLRTDLPLIRVDRTSYSPVPQDRPYEASHFVWEVTSLKYPATHVSFSYDDKNYPFEMYIMPNKGDTLESNAQKGQEMLSALCIHLWHFTYDIKYPVLVTITDEPAKGHERLVFNFGIQVGINNNIPDTTNFGISTFDFDQTAREEEFCSDPPLTNMLNVHTFENVSTEEMGDQIDELPGVNITFTCIKMKCPLGQSEWAFRGSIARLSRLVPYCINGVLRGEKPGYRTAQTFVSTNEEKTVALYLEPIIKKKFTVVKHYTLTPGKQEPLDDDESAIITLKRNGKTSSGMYPPVEGLSELEFAAKWDYTYGLEIFLADESGIIVGGYRGNWTPRWSELAGSGKIEFHIVEWPYEPEPEDQFARISKLAEESRKIPLPVIK
ncbi:MAG TPA: hypothetical protein ENH24_03910 [Nitrospirae bacterium]|nr:hypothetical protein [Nitrospirota bacterium]